MSADVPTTFLERLRASRLLTAEQIEQACAGVGEEEPYLSRYLVQQKLLTRFQAYQLRLGAARFHADKYVIVDYLGRGANSVVYKARHIYLPNRFVALKTLDIRDLHRSGATICIVTHDERYARHADRAVHLFDGRVVEETSTTVAT